MGADEILLKAQIERLERRVKKLEAIINSLTTSTVATVNPTSIVEQPNHGG